MIKRKFFLLLFLGVAILANAQLSKDAKIYILTCSPGEELYQTFGHSAIRVVDPQSHIDYVFNYGTFDFYSPHFYLHFIQGRLNYMLEVQTTKSFIREYEQTKRDVWASEVNLTLAEKNQVYNFLVWNSLPENKYYLYDFFLDNCATRIIMVLDKTFGDKLKYPDFEINKTYRQALMPYLIDRPWTRFGINLLLGLPADKKLDKYSALFLPDYVDTVSQQMLITTDNGTKPLVIKRSLFVKNNFMFKPKPWFNPTLTFWILAVLFTILFFFERKQQKIYLWIDAILWFIVGFAGILMLFMWFGTDHSPTKGNLNLIWAFPLHIIYAFIVKKWKNKKIIKFYSLIFSVIYLILILTFHVFPQQFDSAMLPLLYIFGLTMFNEFYFSKK